MAKKQFKDRQVVMAGHTDRLMFGSPLAMCGGVCGPMFYFSSPKQPFQGSWVIDLDDLESIVAEAKKARAK